MLAGFPPVAGPLKLLAERRAAEHARVRAAAAELGDRARARLFGDDGSRAWLYGAAMHGDVPPDGAGSAIAAVYLNLLGHAVGWPSPRGRRRRAGRRARRLPRSARRRGRAPARASSACVAARPRHRRRLAGGERVVGAARRSPTSCRTRSLALAGDALDGRYRAPLRRYRYGPATLKVDWALDGPIPWSGAEARARRAPSTSAAASEDLADAIARVARGLPEHPFLLLGQQSIADPTRAPAGKHTAWAYTHGPARASTGRRERDRTSSASRRRSSASRPGFRELHPRPPRARARPTCRRATRNLVAATSAAARYSARPGDLPPAAVAGARTARRCAASISAAPRRSPAAPSTASPATPPRGPH